MKNPRSKIEEILGIMSLEFKNLQCWNDLKKVKVGEVVIIDGTTNEKLICTDRHMRWKTTIPPGLSFGPHWHDFLELVKVVSGLLADKIKGKVWRTGETYKVVPMEEHHPYNPSPVNPTELIVDFYYKDYEKN